MWFLIDYIISVMISIIKIILYNTPCKINAISCCIKYSLRVFIKITLLMLKIMKFTVSNGEILKSYVYCICNALKMYKKYKRCDKCGTKCGIKYNHKIKCSKKYKRIKTKYKRIKRYNIKYSETIDNCNYGTYAKPKKCKPSCA